MGYKTLQSPIDYSETTWGSPVPTHGPHRPVWASFGMYRCFVINENRWHLWLPGIFHPNVGNITWSMVWWSCFTTPVWMLTVVESSSWLDWSTPWEAASGSMWSPQAGDGQRRLSCFWSILKPFTESIIRSHWLHGAVLFHCPRYHSQRFSLNWERVQENKADGFIFRFVISSSLMDSKHQKATTQKMENITFSRWGWKYGRQFKVYLLSDLQSRNTSWINNRRFSFVSWRILSTMKCEQNTMWACFITLSTEAFNKRTFQEEVIAGAG